MATSSDDPVRRDEAPAIRVRTRGNVGPVVWGIVGAVVSLIVAGILGGTEAIPLAAQIPLWILPVVAIALSLGTSVRVGADGIAVGWALRRMFVPAADVRAVDRYHLAPTVTSKATWVLVLQRRSTSTPLRLPLVGVAADRVDAIEARIRGLIARTAERRDAALTALHRGQRDLAGWRRDMAALLAGGGFRRAAISAEDLQEVLDDPAASGEQKLGAALALRGAGGAMDRERVRIAAVASARPKLRVALEKVATDEEEPEEAIAEALAESEAEVATEVPRAG